MKHQTIISLTSNPEIVKRFWSKVRRDKPEKCWEWTAATNGAGYGVFGFLSYTIRAHRFSFALSCKRLEDTKFVCHTCDNRKCVNPKHLFLGTNDDNVADMISKGRQSPPPPMGGWNKYTYTKEVISLLGKLSDAEIARRCGVSKPAIRRERVSRGIPKFPRPNLKKKGG